jgi:hypothetical protein
MRLDRERKFVIGKILLIISILGSWAFMTLNFELWINNEMKSIWIHTPSIVEENEKFEITVQAWDKFERLSSTYNKEISFSIESYNYSTFASISANYSLPPDYLFTSNYYWGGIIPAYKIASVADNGRKSFEAIINTSGIHYIKVVEKLSGNIYRSNPIIIKPIGTIEKRLYWGDIHGHTLLSDGSGSQSEAYEFARDVGKLDFAALTDHAEYFPRLGDWDLFNVFQNYIQITNDFNEPGKFTTIVAMEWTPDLIVRGAEMARGHINVYFKGDSIPFFSTLTHQNPDEIYTYLKEKSDDDFMAWTHHPNVAQFGSDYAYYDEEINRLIEIYSMHGSAETYGADNLVKPFGVIEKSGFSVRDALKMGRKFGIMVSSDTHDGRLGHSIGHTGASAYNQYPYNFAGYRLYQNYPGGLTGIYSPGLNRDPIFDSLYNRSCYGTTWVNRHYIEFSINGTSIGVNDSTLVVPNQNSHRELNITIYADRNSVNPNSVKKIKEVNIYKNSLLWYSNKSIDNFLFKTTLLDTDQITGNGFDYYYLRMQDTDGGAAWIGPIWVEYP